jgi:hypothetical protein
MSGVTVSLSKGLIKMSAQQCAADRPCRGGGDEVDVGGRSTSRSASFEMEGWESEEDMIATVGHLKSKWQPPHGGRAVDPVVPVPTTIR